MKIQSINHQNNVSHKAYFKKNLLYKEAINSESFLSSRYHLVKLSEQFKALPNHELEIVEPQPQFFKVINNENGRSMPLNISDRVPRIEKILEKVLSLSGKYLFESEDTLSQLYRDLSTPGHELENLDSWRKLR